jgi:putative membrane protein
MFLSVFTGIMISLLLGMFSGIITGLVPGLHVNLITLLVVSSVSNLFLGIPLVYVAVGIISLALTHSFLDSIPSVFLGAPDESQVVAVLPGHQFFLEGKGHLAVLLTLVGSLFSLILTILFIPIGFKILITVQKFISPYIAIILILVVIFLLILSKKFFLNTVFFLLSGIFGLLSFQLIHQTQILLPLLSGMFGVSTLLVSILGEDTSKKVKQTFPTKIPLESSDIERVVSRSTIVGLLASFLPGFGSSQAAIVASVTMKEKTPKDYLLLVGGINTVNFAFSIVTVALLGKARNGAILGVKNILGTITTQQLLIFIPVLLMVGGLATILGIFLSKKVALILEKLPYTIVVLSVLWFLMMMVIFLSGLQGFLLLIISSALGLLAGYYGAQKNMLLGVLLLPVIIYLF